MSRYILGLDVGDKRIGVALANTIARLPSPLKIITPDELKKDIAFLVKEHNIETVIVGLPLSSDGSENQQTAKIRSYVDLLRPQISEVKIHYVNEALTSKDAANYIASQKRFKDRRYYDDIAACYIIEEYLNGAVI